MLHITCHTILDQDSWSRVTAGSNVRGPWQSTLTAALAIITADHILSHNCLQIKILAAALCSFIACSVCAGSLCVTVWPGSAWWAVTRITRVTQHTGVSVSGSPWGWVRMTPGLTRRGRGLSRGHWLTPATRSNEHACWMMVSVRRSRALVLQSESALGIERPMREREKCYCSLPGSASWAGLWQRGQFGSIFCSPWGSPPWPASTPIPVNTNQRLSTETQWWIREMSYYENKRQTDLLMKYFLHNPALIFSFCRSQVTLTQLTHVWESRREMCSVQSAEWEVAL